MTSHLDEGRLQELVDGEIPSTELGPIQAHLGACAECRARLDEARAIGAEADRLIETIELPVTSAREVSQVPRARSTPWVRNVAWAATVVIAAGVGYLARSPEVARPAAELKDREPVVAEADSHLAKPAPTQPGRSLGAAQASRESAKVTADLRPASEPPAERARNELKRAPTSAGKLTQLATAADSDSGRKKAAGGLGDSSLRLEEGVTAAANDRRAAASPPAPALTKQTESRLNTVNRLDALAGAAAKGKAAEAPVTITLEDALKRLDGSLRLIEGMVPLRLEALGAEVRVIYPLGTGVLLLAERLEHGKLVYRLEAPPGFPADSLERLRARVRE